jgi:hypothetical protein
MRSLQHLRTSRRRRGQRGAAFVESIIVSAMLMTFLAGGFFLHRLYVAQHKALEQARLAAWGRAMGGCSSVIDMNAIFEAATNANGGDMDVDTESAPPAFFGAVSHTSASASQTATAHARVGGGSYTLSANDSVACNETVQDEKARNLESLLGYVTSNLIPNLF